MKLQSSKSIFVFWLALGLFWILSYLLLGKVVSTENFASLQLILARVSVVIVIILVVLLLIQRLPSLLRNPPHQPLIGVFRIVFFGLLGFGSLVHPSFRQERVAFFKNTSFELSNSNLIAFVHPEAIYWALLTMGVAGVLAMIGWQTRKAIFIFFLASFYVFASTNLFGKINHSHHIFWFPMILLFSNCHRHYSIDEWLIKRKGEHRPYYPDYGLVFLWVTIGVIYFFPGFWKIWRSGLDWIFTDNIVNQFHMKWYAEDWLPIFRIDYYPILMKVGALTTILFELSFISMLFHTKTRWFAIIFGCLFHLGTWLFLDIFFYLLPVAYMTMLPFKKSPALAKAMQFQGIKRSAIIGLFSVFIGGNIWAGFVHRDGLFFTCYPTFSFLVGDTAPRLSYSRNRIPVPINEMKSFYPKERYQFWEYEAIQLYKSGKIEVSKSKLKALLEPYRRSIGSQDTLRVYFFEDALNPEKRTLENNIKGQLLYQDPE